MLVNKHGFEISMKLEVLYFIMSFFLFLKKCGAEVLGSMYDTKEHHRGCSNHNLGIQSITGYNGSWNIKVLFFFFFPPWPMGVAHYTMGNGCFHFHVDLAVNESFIKFLLLLFKTSSLCFWGMKEQRNAISQSKVSDTI